MRGGEGVAMEEQHKVSIDGYGRILCLGGAGNNSTHGLKLLKTTG